MDDMHERIKRAAERAVKVGQQTQIWKAECQKVDDLSNPINMMVHAQWMSTPEHRQLIKEANEAKEGLFESLKSLCKYVPELVANFFATTLDARKADPDNAPIESRETFEMVFSFWQLATNRQPATNATMFGIVTYEDYVDWCHGKRELDLPDEG